VRSGSPEANETVQWTVSSDERPERKRWPGKAVEIAPQPCELMASIHEELALTRSEIWRLEKYLRNLFRLDTITIVERPKQADSVEVQVNGEFVGVLFKDEEDGEVSYAFNMAILEMDLPEPPTTRV
jgi:ribosome-associated translation inhibitor RaiA